LSYFRTHSQKMPVDLSGQDERFRGVMARVEQIAQRQLYSGPIITPKTTIAEAVAGLGKEGGRLLLSEGIWNFTNTLDITQANVQLISTSPGNTVFKKKSTSGRPAILLSGQECVLEGIRFSDGSTTADDKTVDVSGDLCVVRNCVFADVNIGVYASGIDYLTIENCHFLDSNQAGIYITGTSKMGAYRGNMFKVFPGGGYGIYLDDNVSDSMIVGNVADTSITKAYSYKPTAANMAVTANVGQVDGSR